VRETSLFYLVVALRLACFALFWLTVPLLLAARGRFKVPWWLVVTSATVLGWIFTNGAVFLQHRVIDEALRRQSICYNDAIQQDQKTTVIPKGDGVVETEVEGPCGGLGDFLLNSYRPFRALLYGPLFLLCCSLPYWLIVVRRTSPGTKRQVALLAVAVFVIEWAGIFRQCIRPGYFDQVCANADSYIWPPLTIAAAAIVSWVLTTQLLQRFGRRI
jgi:hypothetical protein